MTGQEIILDAETDRRNWDYREPVASRITMIEHSKLLELHARALACHCECLGMNAENMWAAVAGKDPVYLEGAYHNVLQKWGITGNEGEPLI